MDRRWFHGLPTPSSRRAARMATIQLDLPRVAPMDEASTSSPATCCALKARPTPATPQPSITSNSIRQASAQPPHCQIDLRGQLAIFPARSGAVFGSARMRQAHLVDFGDELQHLFPLPLAYV